MALDPSDRAHGRAEVFEILNPDGEYVPVRMQVSVVSGHRADLGILLMDPDPLKIDAIVQRLRASRLGTVLEPTYSFVSSRKSANTFRPPNSMPCACSATGQSRMTRRFRPS